MFVLIWATLLFCVRGSSADTGASAWGKKHCQNDYCVTLSEGELTSEAGLCVVILCSFTPGSGFTAQHIIWYKCEANTERCDKGDPIFHSDNSNVQSGFEGRVSLLQPDVSQKNCSIIINDLKESDSGSYQLRITGELNGKQDGFTFISETTVSIKGLNQKPTVMIPTLTEGQQATLTCTAPGLCSGSVPEITWTWRGAGGTESHITGNITALKTENLSAVTQRHISTLTFNPSTEHHNTSIKCKISFTGGGTTEETLTLKVNYVKKVKITGNANMKEGETLNLTCSVESFPPSLITWSKLGSNTNLHKDTGSATLVILNAAKEHSGQYVCTAKYMNNTLRENINLTVMYVKKVKITGETSVKEGQTLNLTCSVESFPPSLITWSKLGSNTNLHKDTGSATLFILNAAKEHSGQYICTAKYMNNTLRENISLTVMYVKKVKITGDTSVKEGQTLNLTCSVESFPPSLITWSKLGSNTNLHKDTGSATLVILNATTEHSGQYICTVKYMNNTLREDISVTVICASGYSQSGFCVSLSKGELTAEAGLCVVIPCSFTPYGGFTPTNLVWYKCEASEQACGDGDIIFHSKNNNKKPQPGFEGRVNLLEPDVSQKNCSIIINDLKVSDSGSYQLRVNGKVNEQNLGYTFTSRVAVSVEGLNQKPTVMIPTLTEGQQATLTCTAPGLCSGSVPEITWTWRGAGGTESHITGNITALKTENLSAVTQRHISTLTFNPSTEHHNTSIKCKISFTGGGTTEETLTLKVNYVKKVKITGNANMKEGETLNLTCSVESFPPSLITWSKLGSNTNLHKDTGSATLVILNAAKEHSGQYVCTAKCMNNTLRENINLTVMSDRVRDCGSRSSCLPWIVVSVSLTVNIFCIMHNSA